MPDLVGLLILAFLFTGMSALPCEAASTDRLPRRSSPSSLMDAPSDPELVEWMNSREAHRSEVRWLLDSGAGYDSVLRDLVASLGIKEKIEPRYRTIEFFDQQGILAERGRLLRARRTFSDESFTKLQSADVTLKVRGENAAIVLPQMESLWRIAGRKKNRGRRTPWCLARGRSCKLEWDVTSGGATSLAFSMKRSADAEKAIRARITRLARLAGATTPKPLCQHRARELSWSAVVRMEVRPVSDVVVDFAWWYQGPGRTHAMEISVKTNNIGVVDFITRRLAHLATNHPSSKTTRYLVGCQPPQIEHRS